MLKALQADLVHGISHITGGGFVENIPRMLPEHLAAEIQLGTWEVLPIFKALEKYGQVPTTEMYEIFNKYVVYLFHQTVSSKKLRFYYRIKKSHLNLKWLFLN